MKYFENTFFDIFSHCGTQKKNPVTSKEENNVLYDIM
jgi:hypothetical protein